MVVARPRCLAACASWDVNNILMLLLDALSYGYEWFRGVECSRGIPGALQGYANRSGPTSRLRSAHAERCFADS